MSIIECKNVTLSYDGLVAVSDLSFSVEKSDYLCIIGDNGTGKTTLMRAILGLKKLSGGSIEFNELQRNRIGYLAQQTETQKEFPASVKEVVLSGCLNQKTLWPFYTHSDMVKMNQALATLNISNLKDKCYRELSGGQQQRVLLARAVCAAQSVLVLDEPTTGLDPKMTTEFFSLVKKMNQSLGMTIIMVTHDTHCAVKYSKHILYLRKDGFFFGSTDEFLHSPEGKSYIGGHRHD